MYQHEGGALGLPQQALQLHLQESYPGHLEGRGLGDGEESPELGAQFSLESALQAQTVVRAAEAALHLKQDVSVQTHLCGSFRG